MARHIIQRLLVSIPVLFGVLAIGFVLLQMIPTDPAAVLAGPTASPAEIESIRESMGLNEPLLYQFALYISRVLQGDLGRSFVSNTPVLHELSLAIGPTIELMVASLIWAVPLGIFLGTVAAVMRGTLIDRAVVALSVIGVSMPIFWFGLILIQYVGTQWNLLPYLGRAGPLWTVEGIRSIALAAITLGGIFVGPVARMTRTAVLEVLDADYVRTARAKGVYELRAIVRHALRNALIPIVTLVGLQVGFLLGGAVVTETIFAWPGVGRLAVGAIISSDFTLAQGAILVLAISFIAVNLIVDLTYAFLDPRIRRS